MGDALAEVQQYRLDTLKVRRFAAHHDGQATGLGADHTAGHRSVQPAHAGLAGQPR
ncbi:hypothetical protein D9M70_617580 [compost metagenome]